MYEGTLKNSWKMGLENKLILVKNIGKSCIVFFIICLFCKLSEDLSYVYIHVYVMCPFYTFYTQNSVDQGSGM